MTDVCVLGGGGQLAEAVSAWLAGRGHRVRHYRPAAVRIPGVPARPPRPRSRLDAFRLAREEMATMDGGMGRYRWTDRSDAARAEVFVYCLPSYLAEIIGFRLAGALHGKYLVNLSDRFLGTDGLCRAAERAHRGWRAAAAVAFNSPPVLAYQRRRDAETSLLYAKPFVLAAPTEPHMTETAASVVADLFGIDQVRWLPSTLELAFENINSIVHAVQDLTCLRTGSFGRPGGLYDPETYTAPMVARIDAVARDRDQIAAIYTGRGFRNLTTFDASTFCTTSLGVAPGTPAYRHRHPLLATVPRPEVFTAHGYEDVGWSLVPLESLGRLARLVTPALSSLIDEWNTLMGVDYRLVGRTAASLGIHTAPSGR